MTSDSFLMALLRCIARRGTPEAIYSDNGSNFVGACAELKKSLDQWDHYKLRTELLRRNIDWHSQLPEASYRGGLWERMIRTVRRILAAVSGQQVLTDESLLTYITEVERIVNDRPLVPVYDDPKNPRVLSPNDL
ncbi:hypothetical protein [Streptococcus dysgalactiae]|uniref:hypothetical protein n=1 Tax=Streptococcus dysgalactiae TaxID=1334 RepID=UPI0019511947|nr:hypothetical protein [Streptococcus dysgalactiae]MBM6549352.1 hypothetical protein [Streptococcus dysgalactiae subsp. equisimilis]